MKKLMFLISTENKTPKQISEEAIKALNKYNKVKKEVLNSIQESKPNSGKIK